MKILLFGHQGQLGWELRRTLPPLGQIFAVDYPIIDLNQPESIRSLILEYQPEIIINASAYTAVDHAEGERESAFAINARAPSVMSELATQSNAALIHFSTDYVFDGKLGRPYLETDLPNPLNVYGESKYAGEQAIMTSMESNDRPKPFLILRTCWVYSLRTDNFVTKVLHWSRKQKRIRLVRDQISNPTWARLLAEITTQILAIAQSQPNPREWLSERSGLYHLAGNGYTSRYEWGKAILSLDPVPEEQIMDSLEPALTSEFPSPATRPSFSALNCDRFASTFKLRLPEWEDALALALNHQSISQLPTHG